MAKGELKYYQHSNGNTYVVGNAGTGTTGDFQVEIIGHHTLTTDNFTGLGRAVLTGTASADTLKGTSRPDTISGGAGADAIQGGLGVDTLTGGADSDTFIYTDRNDSRPATDSFDRITDWASGDRISLKQLDWDPTAPGLQAFVFDGNVSSGTTLSAGHIGYYQNEGGNTFVTGDFDGLGNADFLVRIDGLQTLTGADFELV